MLKRSILASVLLLLFLCGMVGCKQKNDDQFQTDGQLVNEKEDTPTEQESKPTNEQESKSDDETEEQSKTDEESSAAPKPGPAVDWDAPMMVSYNENYAVKYTLSAEDKATLLQLFDACGWQQGGYLSNTDFLLYVGEKQFGYDPNKMITGHGFHIKFDEKTRQTVNTILDSYFPDGQFYIELPTDEIFTLVPFNEKDEPIESQAKVLSAEDSEFLHSFFTRPFTKEDIFSYEDYGDAAFGTGYIGFQYHYSGAFTIAASRNGHNGILRLTEEETAQVTALIQKYLPA